jgi:hypothetical protein
MLNVQMAPVVFELVRKFMIARKRGNFIRRHHAIKQPRMQVPALRLFFLILLLPAACLLQDAGTSSSGISFISTSPYPPRTEISNSTSNSRSSAIETPPTWAKNIAREELSVPGHFLALNGISALHRRFPAFDGSGIKVSIKEFRFDTQDIDLRGRYLRSPLPAFLTSTHAGVMATLIAGAGNSTPSGRGVARGARVLSSSFIGLMPDSDADYAAYDIGVQNHAYGADIDNRYAAAARAYDQSVEARAHLLHVFSAGNTGTETTQAGKYAGIPGFANLSGNFKMAKNVLCVGATDSFNQVLPISARGPAYDGRLKPELVAFGINGSSESAALVAGAAAVLQQVYRDITDTLPSAAMQRALLLNSSEDLYTPGPDYQSGYGSLKLDAAVQTLLDGRFASGQLSAGALTEIPLTLGAHLHQLRVTLCWNDPAAPENAPKALLNNLDLEVVGPDGQTHLPWVLNTAAHADSLLLPARRGRDTLNNTEQILITFPQAGTYTLRVLATQLQTAAQAFSLAFGTDSLRQLEWRSPAGGEHLPPETAIPLIWNDNLDSDKAILEWKPLAANQWQLIDTVALATKHTIWQTPVYAGAAQVRLRTPARSYPSDTFLLAPQPQLKVALNCPDATLLTWNAAIPNARYRLWGLGALFLEPLLTSNDTFLYLPKNLYPQQRFALSVLDTQGFEGSIGAAPDISQQAAGCYFSSILADITFEKNIEIALNIGSDYGLKRIFLKKIKAGGDAVLMEENPARQGLQTFTDTQPEQGLNRYFALAELVNGQTVSSDTAAVYLARNSDFLVFPNPLSDGRHLQLLSQTSEEARFELYDAAGKLVLEQAAGFGIESVVVAHLSAGMYHWQVIRKSDGVQLAFDKLLLFP